MAGWRSQDLELPSRETKQVEACEGNCRQIATGWVLERKKTCDTSGEGGLKSFGPLCDVFKLQGKRSRLETKREGLRSRKLLGFTGNQLMHPSVFDGQKSTVASLAGKGTMPCSEFA